MLECKKMIITKNTPFTKQEIKDLQEEFDSYIKTVIDVKKKICSAGCNRHFESEKILIEQGSAQLDIWGGGIDIETKEIDFNSFINIKPNYNNSSNEILDEKLRIQYDKLTRFLFGIIYEK